MLKSVAVDFVTPVYMLNSCSIVSLKTDLYLKSEKNITFELYTK